MGTEVLRPQDCLIERIRFPATGFSRRKTDFCNHNGKPRCGRNKSAIKSDQIKRNSYSTRPISKRSCSSEDLRPSPKRIVMGNFTLIRRGESLEALRSRVCSNKIDDPQNQIMMKESNHTIGIYAGPAFAVSPSPESLPVPSFSKKMMITVDGSATRDLRRLLGLD